MSSRQFGQSATYAAKAAQKLVAVVIVFGGDGDKHLAAALAIVVVFKVRGTPSSILHQYVRRLTPLIARKRWRKPYGVPIDRITDVGLNRVTFWKNIL
jgi:uncharacterized SAM-binding protein YcdF (DUF218 family)